MQIYIFVSGLTIFGAWRDEMQADGWLIDKGQQSEILLTQIDEIGIIGMMNNKELKMAVMEFGKSLSTYTNKTSLDSNIGLVLHYMKKFARNSESLKKTTLTIKDDYYQESLDKKMKRIARL